MRLTLTLWLVAIGGVLAALGAEEASALVLRHHAIGDLLGDHSLPALAGPGGLLGGGLAGSDSNARAPFARADELLAALHGDLALAGREDVAVSAVGATLAVRAPEADQARIARWLAIWRGGETAAIELEFVLTRGTGDEATHLALGLVAVPGRRVAGWAGREVEFVQRAGGGVASNYLADPTADVRLGLGASLVAAPSADGARVLVNLHLLHAAPWPPGAASWPAVDQGVELPSHRLVEATLVASLEVDGSSAEILALPALGGLDAVRVSATARRSVRMLEPWEGRTFVSTQGLFLDRETAPLGSSERLGIGFGEPVTPRALVDHLHALVAPGVEVGLIGAEFWASGDPLAVAPVVEACRALVEFAFERRQIVAGWRADDPGAPSGECRVTHAAGTRAHLRSGVVVARLSALEEGKTWRVIESSFAGLELETSAEDLGDGSAQTCGLRLAWSDPGRAAESTTPESRGAAAFAIAVERTLALGERAAAGRVFLDGRPLALELGVSRP